ncbi:MAG: hypothetical protein AAF234_11470 [Pseudomonadota bacterium]
MSEKIADFVELARKLHNVHRQGKELLKGQELYDFLGIQERHDQDREQERILYNAEYKKRVSVVYTMLLDRATAQGPKLKPRYIGHDQLNPKTLMRKAEFFVRSEHVRTMSRLDASELKESNAFMEKSTQRRAYADSFNTSAKQRQKTSRATRNHSPKMTD